jgi:hypothetical protein
MGFSSSASPSISATIHSILRADSSKAFRICRMPIRLALKSRLTDYTVDGLVSRGTAVEIGST